MARFNAKNEQSIKKLVPNREGHASFKVSDEAALASLMLTSFLQDQYYRSKEETFNELVELVQKVSPEFAAKCAVFARQEFGMRSITHVVAAILPHLVKGTPITKTKDGKEIFVRDFVRAVVRRPDDMLEILSLHYLLTDKNAPIPGSLKRGLADAFNKFDRYQLAKYRGQTRELKLIDLVRLVHPRPTVRNAEALKDLIKGTLRSEDTWESKLTAVGQNAKTAEERQKMQDEVWNDLLVNKKLGYLALVRNIRNISEQTSVATQRLAWNQLQDQEFIEKSLIFPHQLLTASKQVANPWWKSAFANALKISFNNVPQFDGKTLVVCDVSGSMHKFLENVGIFAGAIANSSPVDVIAFGTIAKFVQLNFDNILNVHKELEACGQQCGWGTDIHGVFKLVYDSGKIYDRIIIITDMQENQASGWITAQKIIDQYKKVKNADPFIYWLDFTGYGTTQVNQKKFAHIAGFSDKIFKFMKYTEQDPNIMINTIKNIDITKY